MYEILFECVSYSVDVHYQYKLSLNVHIVYMLILLCTQFCFLSTHPHSCCVIQPKCCLNVPNVVYMCVFSKCTDDCVYMYMFSISTYCLHANFRICTVLLLIHASTQLSCHTVKILSKCAKCCLYVRFF